MLDTGNKADNLSLIYALAGLIVIAFLVVNYEKTRCSGFVAESVMSLEEERQINMYIYSLVVLAENSNEESCRQQLHYAFKVHYDRMIRSVTPDTEELEPLKLILTEKCKPTEYKQICFEIINLMIDKARIRCSQGNYLRLIKASLMNARLDNKWEAIYQLDMILKSGKYISWPTRLSAEFVLRDIEHELMEAEIKDGQNTGINIMKTLELQSGVSKLMESITTNTDNVLALWTELAGDNVSGNKVENTGISIAILHQSIKVMFEEIIKQNSSHLKTLMIHGHYLQDVMNEQDEGDKILSKALTLRNSLQNNQAVGEDARLRLHNNINPCIVIASASRESMGIIINANPECNKTIGWNNADIIGKRLDNIMPKIYADHHDTWMRRFFIDNRSTVMNMDRKIFVLSRSGFIVPCNLIIKMFPDLQEGLKVVGTFSSIARGDNKTSTILFNGMDGTLAGTDETAYSKYGLHPFFCYGVGDEGKTLNMARIFPKIQKLEQIKESNIFRHPQDLNSKDLNSFELLPSHELKNHKLPAREYDAFSHHAVKIQPKSINKYGIDELEIVELTIKDANHINNKVLDEVMSPKQNKSENIENYSKFHKALKSNIHESPEVKSLNNLEESLDEEEIEKRNNAAEKIRRLKELRSGLKKRKLSTRTTFNLLFFIPLFALIVSLGLVLIFVHVLSYENTTLGTDTLYYHNMRISLVPNLARYTHKLMLILESVLPDSESDSVLNSITSIIDQIKSTEKQAEGNFIKLKNSYPELSASYTDYVIALQTDDGVLTEYSMKLYLTDALYLLVNSAEWMANIVLKNSPMDQDDIDRFNSSYLFINRNFHNKFYTDLISQKEVSLGLIKDLAKSNFNATINTCLAIIISMIVIFGLIGWNLHFIFKRMKTAVGVLGLVPKEQIDAMLVVGRSFKEGIIGIEAVGKDDDSLVHSGSHMSDVESWEIIARQEQQLLQHKKLYKKQNIVDQNNSLKLSLSAVQVEVVEEAEDENQSIKDSIRKKLDPKKSILSGLASPKQRKGVVMGTLLTRPDSLKKTSIFADGAKLRQSMVQPKTSGFSAMKAPLMPTVQSVTHTKKHSKITNVIRQRIAKMNKINEREPDPNQDKMDSIVKSLQNQSLTFWKKLIIQSVILFPMLTGILVKDFMVYKQFGVEIDFENTNMELRSNLHYLDTCILNMVISAKPFLNDEGIDTIEYFIGKATGIVKDISSIDTGYFSSQMKDYMTKYLRFEEEDICSDTTWVGENTYLVDGNLYLNF